jgi:hypothetical protein
MCLTSNASLLPSLSGVLTEEELQWFIDLYRDLGKRRLPTTLGFLPSPQQTMDCGTAMDHQTGCRHLCAFNFPVSVHKVGGGKGGGGFWFMYRGVGGGG